MHFYCVDACCVYSNLQNACVIPSVRLRYVSAVLAINVFQILAVAVIAACIWSGATTTSDIIGVLFNGQTRQVSFYRNGTLQFINTRSPPLVDLYPVVYMHYGNDQVTIKQNPRLPLST